MKGFFVELWITVVPCNENPINLGSIFAVSNPQGVVGATEVVRLRLRPVIGIVQLIPEEIARKADAIEFYPRVVVNSYPNGVI